MKLKSYTFSFHNAKARYNQKTARESSKISPVNMYNYMYNYMYIIKNIDIINIRQIFMMYTSQRRLEKRNNIHKFETLQLIISM